MPEGRKVFEELVTVSDVVLSNYRPSAVEKLGLDYDTLGKINPRIICCNISGFGLKGKDVGRPAFDLAIQAYSGLMSVTGEEGGSPLPAGMNPADEKGGIMGTLGILAAYIKRQKDGVGQQVDISMFDIALLSFSYSAFKYYLTGIVPGRYGSFTSVDKRADYGAYEAKDGYFVLVAGRDNEKWRSLCKTLGKDELGMNPEFDSYEKRIKDENRIKLVEIFKPIFREKTREEWRKIFSDADIATAPVNTLDIVLREAEAQGRGMIVDFPLPSGEMGKGISNPVKIGTKVNLNPPPRLGEHTKEILANQLNYSQAKILELAEAKAIFFGE